MLLAVTSNKMPPTNCLQVATGIACFIVFITCYNRPGRERFMYLLVLVLNQTEKLEEILQELYETGISGSTVVDASGMGETTLEKIPVVGGISALFNSPLSSNKVVFSVVQHEETINKAESVVESVVGDLDSGKKGIMFTLPLHRVKGFVSQI